MRAALTIAGKDLKLRMRDRSAWVVAFIAPIVLAVIISAAFSSDDGAGFATTIAFTDLDGTPISQSLLTDVLGSDELAASITTVKAASEEESRAMVTDGRVFGAIVVPAGFTQAITSGERAEVKTITSDAFPVTTTFVEALAASWVARLDATRVGVVTAMRAGSDTPLPELAALAAQETSRGVAVVDADAGTRNVKPANYFGPGMAIFFLFFTVGFAARGLVGERDEGTLRRLAASPISRTSILVGKALPALLIGLLSMVVMFAVMSLALDVSWGNPIALGALSLATVFAIFGVTSLVQIGARTQQQAQTIAQVLGASLALLGGNFFPLHEMPQAMQRLALFTPNAWALRGFSDVAFDGVGLSGVYPSLLVLLAIGAVAGALAVSRAGRLVRA